MTVFEVTRPQLPPGYADNPKSSLTWEYVILRLTQSKNYWLCSVRPDGRPHSVPRWGIFLDENFYYDGSPNTRHARNILQNPQVSLHLESGDEAVILEGISSPIIRPETVLANQLSAAFCLKYSGFGYSPAPDQWDAGGLFVFRPSTVLAWTVFFENPTKFVLAPKG